MENNPIKAGLIGFGTGGSFFHAPFLDAMPEFELTAILERTKEKSRERYPKAKIVRTEEELLTIPELELVVITTPNNTHFDLAYKALEKGKHVLLDKPFTVTTKEADRLIEAAKQNNRILTVYHNRRFHSDFNTVKDILDRKVLGEIISFTACFDRFRPERRPHVWKEMEIPGSGILYDLGSHLIDQALTLFGKPEAISADLRVERPGAKTIDFFELIFFYPEFKAILKAGMLEVEPGPVFRLEGKNGVYTKYGLDPQEDLLREGIRPIESEWAIENSENWGVLELNDTIEKVKPLYNDYNAFYKNLYNGIRKKEALAVTTEQARLVIHFIELAFKSNVENKARISL